MMAASVRAALCAAVCAVVVLSGGCGFRLAGDGFALSADTASVLRVTDAPPPLAAALQTRIEAARGHGAATDTDTAAITLKVLDTEYRREPVTIDASGHVSGYRLVYIVFFSITPEADEARRRRVEVERHLEFETQRVPQNRSHEQYLQRQMFAELAQLMLLQVS